jgi:hypothetical protein
MECWPARNASRSDAGGPSLRVAGFEDEDDDEDENEAPCEWRPRLAWLCDSAYEPRSADRLAPLSGRIFRHSEPRVKTLG